MGRKRKVGGSEPKKKRRKVTVKLVQRKNAGKITEPYAILESITAKRHAHLKDAKIALAWRYGWSQDTDGRLKLGQAKKGSDLDRALHKYDFVILLNAEAWKDGVLDKAKKTACMEHELCHCAVSIDADGLPKTDDEERIVYRIRKHTIEEFREVVDVHGLWTHELEEFAQAGINDRQRPLLPQD